MDKVYIKTQIAMRQQEFPVDLISRDNPLPIGNGKTLSARW